jgi:hypothetical protein
MQPQRRRDTEKREKMTPGTSFQIDFSGLCAAVVVFPRKRANDVEELP